MSNKKIVSKSPQQTQQLAKDFAQEILKEKPQKTAAVLALQGDLGAGKTTFVQGFAKALGVQEKVTSPTFILMRHFELSDANFKDFYHIDCYRLNTLEEILDLGFEDLIKNPMNIVAIEWSEKISNTLPKKGVLTIKFKHLKENNRELCYDD